MSEAPSILVESADPAVTVVTLNRPAKRNALSIDLIERLRSAVQEAGDDRRRRALIFRGAGPVFCAGLDLAEAASPELAHRSAEALAAMYLAVCRCPLVTIAAAHGAAFGGGAGLVAACDLAVGADDLRLGYPEVRLGLVAALVTCLLRRQLSDARLRELVLLGQTLSGSQARAAGLLSRACPADKVMETARALAATAAEGAPGAIARTKRLLDALTDRPIDEQLQRALDFHLEARASHEAAEGVAAFREKRAPVWGEREEGTEGKRGEEGTEGRRHAGTEGKRA